MTSGTDLGALVVGGAAAGLSAGLVLGRARVPAVVVDAGRPSNRNVHAIGGLLGQPATSPADFYAVGRAQLDELPDVELRSGTVTAVAEDGDAFVATLEDGSTLRAARLLLAGGMSYDLPPIDGLADLWGTDAFQCPYCHGWEMRDKRLALLGGDGLEHRIPLLRNWTGDLVLVPGGPVGDDVRALGVETDERPVAAVAPGVVRFADGDELRVDAFHVLATLAPRDTLAADLGLETDDTPMGTGFVVADRWGATSHPRVFAAGDRTGGANVAAAVANGNLAATGLHRSLLFG